MTTVAKLIRCLQQHDPNALVVLQQDDVVRPLHIASIFAVALRAQGPEQYLRADDDLGIPGVLLA